LVKYCRSRPEAAFLLGEIEMKVVNECTTGLCQVIDYAFSRSQMVRREMRAFLEAELGASVTLETLPTAAEKFLARDPNWSSYGSLDFGLVLKLLFVCGGRLNINCTSDYRQCPLKGGGDLRMEGIELITSDFDQILLQLRALIGAERSTGCNAVREDHFCKPIYQLVQLKEVELRRVEGAALTFGDARTMLASFCYELSLALNPAQNDGRQVLPAHAKQKVC
jgi:hypothetical protein